MNKYQTFVPRFFALILDAVLLLPLSVAADWMTEGSSADSAKTAVLLGLNLINVFYFIVLHAIFGQTVGKMLMKVRVLDASESRIKYWQALVRDLPQIVFVLASLIPVLNIDLAGRPDVPLTAITLIVFVWGLADILVFAINDKRRALHDLIAGTVVVRIAPQEAHGE